MTVTIGIYGRSGSGKTTLIEALVRALAARGRSVAVIKRTLGRYGIDTPGKDTHRYVAGGASCAVLSSAVETALVLPNQVGYDRLCAALALLGPFDVVLVEGWKELSIPKVRVGAGHDRLPGTVLDHSHGSDPGPVLAYIAQALDRAGECLCSGKNA